jgi:hypothetical protein
MKTKWTNLVALTALTYALAAGCAGEREPINRVQTDALSKSFFVGADLASAADDPEFYTAATVTDVPYGTDGAAVFTGMGGGLYRVKWEITEEYLNARLTYETINGVDGHGARTTNTGKVLGSYKIISHFDIRRDYNPSTGEEYNVIVENVTDRPWYAREFFRVDWSQNLIVSSTQWDPVSDDGWDVESVAYYVNDPAHPDAPHFEADQGYFDITNKLYLKPKLINGIPACFYYGSLVAGATYPWGSCENSEITVRFSYARIAHEGEPGFSDYEPIDWDGSRMNAFGIFTRDRLGWDRNYGVIDDKWHRFAQRYNIWQASHTSRPCAQTKTVAAGCDPTRDTGDINCDGKPDAAGLGPNGTDDECEDGQNWGSRCDTFVGKCTIPYAKRQTRAIPWHYTVNMEDTTIFESTQFATWQWDAAMRMAVQTARYAECVRTGTASLLGSPLNDRSLYAGSGKGGSYEDTRKRCGELYPIDQSHDNAELDAVRDVNMCVKLGKSRAECVSALKPGAVAAMSPMVVLCANPVTEADDPSCGAPGMIVRPGDVRFHQVNVWPVKQVSSPWGFGPSLSDPLTGEIRAASINVYNSVTDSAAQSFVDQVRWINGEISAADITSGKFVHDWVQAAIAPGASSGPLMTPEDVERRISGIAGVDLSKVDAAKIDPNLGNMVAEMARNLDKEVLPPGTIPEDRSVFEERIQRAKETGVEASLMNPMWLQMAGGEQNMPYSAQLDLASPLRGMSSQTLLHEYDKLQQRLADKGQCILGAPEPTGIPAVAKMMKAKFPPLTGNPGPVAQQERVKKMWDYLRFRMHYTVILHEMGHTIGLRHNFVSSYDKYAYKTQYWQLRTDSGKQKTVCKGPTKDGSTCIGPRYYDPLTQDEIDNSEWTWMQSTVMDYAGDITQDMIGLGIYDLAAARMFYGDVVDVRSDTILPAGPPDPQTGAPTVSTKPKTEADRRALAVMGLVDYPGYIFGQAFVNCPQGVGKCGNNPQNGQIEHYSYYNEAFKLVQPERCTPVSPKAPSWWDNNKWGTWSPLWDGEIVHDERCARPPIDFTMWSDLVPDAIRVDFDDPRFFTPRRAFDAHYRPRVPYGFLTDNYADGWSPTAYRHDNGADMYEEIVFHSSLYENRHIFDNFRNGRATFSIYGAYQRALSRYHVKVANLTQGLAYGVAFILREFGKNAGAKFTDVLKANIGEGGFLHDHAVAAAVGFDHFTRVMTRPHIGPHFCRANGALCDINADRLLKPAQDEITPGSSPIGTAIVGNIPNGNQIAGNSLAYGGRPLNNGFQYAHGFWTWNYLNQAGSYYEKTFATEQMLNATFGAINFFRFDGLDARFRHVNFADLYPDGMRRLLGAMLTEDPALIAPRMSSSANGQPKFVNVGPDPKAPQLMPGDALAWVSYAPTDGPIACAPVGEVLSCTDSIGTPIGNGASTTPAWFVDPQLGFEVQKFIVFWFYVYQPGAGVLDWVEQLRIYRLGSDIDPTYLPKSTVEWRDPESGLRYIARKYGDETLFGKTYDKGMAAKMIQWANKLTADVYELDATTPFDPVTGAANVLFNTDGSPKIKNGAAKDDVPKWTQLRNYRGLIDYTRDTAAKMGFPEPALQIIIP